jgi:hypothetical protein
MIDHAGHFSFRTLLRSEEMHWVDKRFMKDISCVEDKEQTSSKFEPHNYQEQLKYLLSRPTHVMNRDFIPSKGYMLSSIPCNAISSGTNLASYPLRYGASFQVSRASVAYSLLLISLGITILNACNFPCSDGMQKGHFSLQQI